MAWSRARFLAGVGAVVVLLAIVATLDRSPTIEPDTQLYASIAKAWQRDGSGVPTVLPNPAEGADHVRFYGPVYFQLTGLSFQVFGLSKHSARLVSAMGVFVILLSAVSLSISLAGRPRPWIWSVLLIGLAPEVRYAATNGAMESLAVGFVLCGLALLVRCVTSGRRWCPHAVLAGLALALAALTTPRTYPLIIGVLFAAQGLLPREGHGRAPLVAIATLAAVWGGWVWWYCGDPGAWIALLFRVAANTGADVGWVGPRTWAVVPVRLITPMAVVIIGAFGLGRLMRMRRRRRPEPAAEFALAAVGFGGALSFAMMNLTFLFGIYFAVPLLVVLLALPWPALGVPVRVRRTVVGALLGAYLLSAGLTYVRVGLSWDARDPALIRDFVQTHVPQGATVAGPRSRFFFAVESAGASYMTVLQESFADWAQWATDPNRVSLPAISSPLRRPQFLLWPSDWLLPTGYECAAVESAVHYVPPPVQAPMILTKFDGGDLGYPPLTLYRLGAGCPAEVAPVTPETPPDELQRRRRMIKEPSR